MPPAHKRNSISISKRQSTNNAFQNQVQHFLASVSQLSRLTFRDGSYSSHLSLHLRSLIMTSLILLDLPPSSFCAIDLASFTTTPRFRGVKNIPPGIHFCYFSPTSDPIDPTNTQSRITDLENPTSLSSSLHFRTGFFFIASPSTPYLIRKWCSKTESLLSESDIPPYEIQTVKKNIQQIHHEHLSPYEKLQVPEDKLVVWNSLVSSVNKSQTTLSRISGSSWTCESARETKWEKEELDEAIRSKTEITGSRKMFGPERPPNSESEEDQEVLDYTKIDLKRTWPPNAVGRERTVWARDRSWVLTDIFRKLTADYNEKIGRASSLATANSTAESLAASLPLSEDTEEGQAALLAELAVSFILTVLLANYSSTIQFKHILEVSLTAGEAIKSHTKYFVKLVSTLEAMLRAARLIAGEKAESDDEDDEDVRGVPVEEAVLEEFVSGGDAWLIKLLRGFNRELKDAEEGKYGREMKMVKEGIERLERVCRRFGWYLDDQYVRKGMMDLPAEEGGGRVEVELEDMEGEDERGEFAPVIVEL
ncbi:hypothetical protein TWF694_008912 [Orbilia ellipsospora]|uniref:Uncharacterized protein n=1 Tax=Orbilia ellipsospora TaxID=2528407 RepID=A0AAV9XGL6_9PEZI